MSARRCAAHRCHVEAEFRREYLRGWPRGAAEDRAYAVASLRTRAPRPNPSASGNRLRAITERDPDICRRGGPCASIRCGFAKGLPSSASNSG
jgi:hypothetical protein